MEEIHTNFRVLQVNKLYYPCTGGIEQTVQEISEGLSRKVDLQVLVCRTKGKTSIEDINGVNVVRAGSLGRVFSMPVSIAFFRCFNRMARDTDIIQFHMPFPIGDLACLLSHYKGKVVVWWHSDIVRQKKLMFFYKPIMKRFLNRADVIIVGDEGIINGSKYLTPYKEKCVVIPFGVNRKLELIANDWLSNNTIVKKDKDIHFLFIGRLVYYKGCDILLKAFTKIKGATLIMVGDGKLKSELNELIKVHQLEDRVFIVSNVDDKSLPKYIQECDVLVLPSVARSEAFGLVQIEAMAFGKPVINTNLKSGVPNVGIHGETGLTVEPNNIEDLAKAMTYFVEHPHECKSMGENARKRYENTFKSSMMLEKLYQLYSSILKTEE